jgi:hypothetical protein
LTIILIAGCYFAGIEFSLRIGLCDDFNPLIWTGKFRGKISMTVSMTFANAKIACNLTLFFIFNIAHPTTQGSFKTLSLSIEYTDTPTRISPAEGFLP